VSCCFRRVRKIAKATISFVISVRPSVYPFGCQHGTTRLPQDGFSWNPIFINSLKTCSENWFTIKIAQEWRVHYVKADIHFLSYLAQFFLQLKYRKYRESKQTFYIEYISFEICAVYEIMWSNCSGHGRPRMKIWRMLIACWVPNAKITRFVYVIIYCFSTATTDVRTRLNVTLYIHWPSCWATYEYVGGICCETTTTLFHF